MTNKNVDRLIASIEDFSDRFFQQQKNGIVFEESSQKEETRKTRLPNSSFTKEDVFNLMFHGYSAKDILEYERIIPGFKNRILNMIESEIEHQVHIANMQKLSPRAVVTPVTVALAVNQDFNAIWEDIRKSFGDLFNTNNPKGKS